ncbi:MAG: DUF378 domain-containing protein [Phycisphaeraceae bacterium]
MKLFDIIAAVLLVVGGLNWGLVGLADFDLVATLFGGSTTVMSKIVYTLVGAAAVYQAISLKSIMKRWHVVPAMG